MRGTIARWISDRGFGFVAGPNGDVFVHIREVAGQTEPSVGDVVEFDTATNPKDGRPRAVNVRVLD